jgi:PAS domain S-box-containing protein
MDNPTTYKRLLRLLTSLFRSKTESQRVAHAERRFQALIENGLEVITLMDEQFMPLYRSPASERVTGWTWEDRVQKGMLTMTHPDDLPSLQKILKSMLDNPGKPYMVCFRTRHKDGHYIWLEGSVINLLHDHSTRAIVTNLHDITESKTAGSLLEESHEELRLLASHLQDVREEERTSMAREIHDELGQLLTGLKMDVSWLNRRTDLNDGAARDKIRGVLTLLDTTINTVRRLAAELRPSILDDLGLPEALEWHSRQFEKRSSIHSQIAISGDRQYMPPDIATGLFRIYQEALTNVARHAKATTVSAELDMEDEQVVLTISDDGKGFDVKGIGSKKTLGLLGMKERVFMMGGRYELNSRPMQGTTIRVLVPLEKDLVETK